MVCPLIFPFSLCTSHSSRDSDTFITLDSEDGPVAGPSSLRPNPNPAAPLPGPSRYSQAIDAISQCFGVDHKLEDEEDLEEDPDLEVLDDIGIWKAIGNWLRGALNFEILLKKLDFQHGKHAKTGYWEHLVSELAFETDLDRREKRFNAITLPEHHRRLTAYQPSSVRHAVLRESTSPPPQPSPSNVADQILLWFVRIAPGEFFSSKVSSIV